ncbi:MAG: hypothetical protein A2W99_00315 [Bacteroidetes bacterium GWF2_33_16]|nr:MAG: hypothetical protein A2X00_03020 [Bacteroidetes bacterium GWE2_32_14]OFY08717.1 MAG: hypothetical protein A2W99_00315 [Bacteroidetes bacterium GWF2_33_16]
MDRQSIIKQFEPVKDNLLNILHALQNSNPENYLSVDDLKLVSHYLNITYSSVYGVVKYYSMFSLKPRGKYVIRICKSPMCHMIGNKEIIDGLKETGYKLGETSGDKLFSVEETECLGRCAKAPALMINDKTYTALDRKKLKELIQSIKLNEQNTK